jgi:hypothetical protein
MQVFRCSGIQVLGAGCWVLLGVRKGERQRGCIGRLGGLCALLAASLFARPCTAQEKTVTVPLTTLKTRHIVVPVRINGQGPFRLALDTGSPITFVSNRVARKLKLLEAETAASPLLMGIRGQTPVKSFAVGGARTADFEVLILDHPVIELLSQVDGPVDGIVGYSFFGRFRTTIDYAAGKVTFTPVKYAPKNVMRTIMSQLVRTGPEVKVQAPAALWGLAVDKQDEADGVRVTQVYAGSAAAAAGLRVGDRILTIDGRWTETITDTYDILAEVKVGQAVPVVALRDGAKIEITVKPRAGL